MRNLFAARLLGDGDLHAIDVGARGDLPPSWITLDGVFHVTSFEPDSIACAALKETYARRGHGHLYRTLPIALSGTGGRRTLYVTNSPSGASLLSADTVIAAAYVDHDYLFPVSERTVDTRTLSDVMDEYLIPRVDMLKLDIQGCELEVLQGLGSQRLRQAVSVELEACIEEQYRGEPTFFQIHAFMIEHGFELLDMRTPRTHRTLDGRKDAYQTEVFGVHGESPTVSARLLDVDGIYFRRMTDVLDARDIELMRRLATAYCAYGFFSEAHFLLGSAADRGTASRDDIASLQAAIVGWHHSRRWRRTFNRPTRFWTGVRLVTKAVGMADEVVERLAVSPREVLDKVLARATEVLRGR